MAPSDVTAESFSSRKVCLARAREHLANRSYKAARNTLTRGMRQWPDLEFDHDRPYCSLNESFVSPMRADICNDRHDFTHEADCEVYRSFAPEETEEFPSIEATD